jgi:hypothetical protein
MLGVQFNRRTVLQQLRSAALQLKQPQQLLSTISRISTDVLLWLIYHKGMYQQELEFQHGTPNEAPFNWPAPHNYAEHMHSDAHQIQVQQVSTCTPTLAA